MPWNCGAKDEEILTVLPFQHAYKSIQAALESDEPVQMHTCIGKQ
jgi:hypothetical protein